eukprot:scaffold1104_cov299-Prasinococcus_capsulatus_cf.AAC.18
MDGRPRETDARARACCCCPPREEPTQGEGPVLAPNEFWGPTPWGGGAARHAGPNPCARAPSSARVQRAAPRARGPAHNRQKRRRRRRRRRRRGGLCRVGPPGRPALSPMASLKQAFEDAGFEIDDATVHKAELLCVREDVSSADLAERWEVFSFNKCAPHAQRASLCKTSHWRGWPCLSRKKGDVVTEKDFKEFDAWITPKLAKERMNKVNTYVYTKPELDDMDMVR